MQPQADATFRTGRAVYFPRPAARSCLPARAATLSTSGRTACRDISQHQRGQLSIRLLVRGRDRLTGGQTYIGNEQKSGGFLRVKSSVETLARNGLVRRTTRHLWVSKYSLTVLFLDTILSSFFAIRTSSSSRVIVAFTPPPGGCLQGRRIDEGGESWLKRSVLDPLSRTLRTTCSIQSRGVSCSGTQSDQHDT